MLQQRRGSSSALDRPFVTPPRKRSGVAARELFFAVMLSLLLLSDVLGGWGFTLPRAYAAGRLPSPPANMTFQQFLKQGRHDRVYHGPFVHPQSAPAVPGSSHEHSTDYRHLPPSAELVTMKPINQPLDASLLAGSAGGKALYLVGSDKRLEVQIQPGSLDVSHATVPAGGAPSGTLTLQFSEIHGHFAGGVNLLGAYSLTVVDGKGQTISGMRLLKPVTFVYHYQPWELVALDLDPDKLFMTWPDLLATARKANQSTSAFTIALVNDPKAHTLTGQSTVFGPAPLDVGGGDPQNQSPPIPHLASVQGNAGQLSYAYPLQLPPGPAGFAPQLLLKYSSSGPNERHSRTSPGNDVGDGWVLSLGSVSAEVYPAGSASAGTWYFLSGVGNVGDRLIPNPSDGTAFLTEHISQLRIRTVTSSSTGQMCFNVWDTSGTYYQFGCTSDSLQYRADSSGTHYYRWDLNKIVAPNEGPGTSYKLILVSYLQDAPTINGYTSVRDAAMKQILYGYGTSTSSIGTLVGTIDFFYKAPYVPGGQSQWASAYGTNYQCTNPPLSTTLRCDDPLDNANGLAAPTVMSTLSLQTVTSYVGSDASASNKAYKYSFSYTDSPFSQCWDDYTQLQEYCAGLHLLSSLVPTIYQNGTGHDLKALTLSYTLEPNNYNDSQHTIQNGTQQYTQQTYWKYLTSYLDNNTGVGGTITYQTAHSNTHGTPNATDGDDRYDPLYCSLHTDCTGNYAPPDDHAWSVQVVTSITTSGKDSSASTLALAKTTYNYRLAKTGTYSGNPPYYCYPAGTDQDCVGDNWFPNGDGDWQDYYHSEFRGFNAVYITSPASDLTADYFFSTKGWGTPQSDGGNYNAGHLYQEDIYSGNAVVDTNLLRRTTSTHTSNPNTCNGTYNSVYPPCEVMVLSSRATLYERTGSSNSNAPWVQTDNTYDDYSSTSGLIAGYHNLTQQVISSSNAPTLTRKWTYTTNDQTVSGWVYYNVHHVTSGEVDDSSGHVWLCQDTTFDEGVATGVPTPDAGWPTTLKTYSNCTNKSGTIIKNYLGYDLYGNLVATVDGVATSNSSLYGSNGCTLATAPAYFTSSSNWSAGRYTACSTYDTYQAQVASVKNALSQQESTSYDYTQGALPTSLTDANNQVTSLSYSYDANSATNDKQTTSGSLPLEGGSYTTRSNTNSSCTGSSTLPCFEIDSNSSLYANAVSRTFYDSLGRAVETRTPGPGSGYDTIVFTVYNDQAHSVFSSVPFEVATGSSWVDPNGAVDYQGVAPGGTVTYSDALNRPLAVQDPLFGSTQEPGIACSSTLSGNYTACANYGLGTANGDTATYAYAALLDPNNHATVSFGDALGRIRSVQWYSGRGLPSLSSNLNEQKQFQYNVLDEPTSVIAKDLAPQSGQTITQVTTSAAYDDLGRLTSLTDPDRGTHTFSYDADSRVLSDVSGTRTLGYNDDLLGRIGCVQDATPTINATGACSAGNPLVQNTYDTTTLGTQGSTDFPVGQLTQSVATTYYPDGSSATATQKFQHDQRGRLVTAQLQLALPSSWNVTSALPTYQLALSYNDADQLTTATTSTIPSGQGYTFTQVYDSTTGVLTGLSNNSSSTANLATLIYNARAQLDTINFQTTTGTALAGEQFGYDANLRPTSMTATWQSGSGTNGTIFSQNLSYDPASNVISLSTTQAAVPGQTGSGGSETQNFCYDEQNRLVWAGNSGTQPAAGNGTCGSGTLSNSLSGAAYSNSFVYTHLGQLWQGPLNGGSTPYQYLYCNSSHPHQLDGLYPTGTTCSGKSGQVYTSSYDAWGNVTSRFYSGTTATLSYDKLDHFVMWDAGSTNREWYIYDSGGSRVLRRSTNSSSTTLTVYAFGLEEHSYSSSGSNQSNTYYYPLGGQLIGELNGSATQFLLTDALGSVLASVSNVAGSAAVQGNQVYGPYGKQRYKQGTMGTSKGFTGQYNDSLTGLDYYNARYYDPKVGVFLSADTVEGNGVGRDPYAYVGGNPETWSDPTGLVVTPGVESVASEAPSQAPVGGGGIVQ